MGKTKSKRVFHIDKFQSPKIDTSEALAVSAFVMNDGEHVVLDLSPDIGNIVYRIAKDSITIGPENTEIKTFDNRTVTMHHVIVKRGAQVIQMIKGPAEVFLDPIERSRLSQIIETQTLRAKISFQLNGEGTLKYANNNVSCLGKPGLKYPTDLTVQGVIGVDKFKEKYSNEFNVIMPWAVLIWGQRGIYIHEMPDNLEENGGPTAGCIHLSEENAKSFYNWLSGRTRITIDYQW